MELGLFILCHEITLSQAWPRWGGTSHGTTPFLYHCMSHVCALVSTGGMPAPGAPMVPTPLFGSCSNAAAACVKLLMTFTYILIVLVRPAMGAVKRRGQ